MYISASVRVKARSPRTCGVGRCAQPFLQCLWVKVALTHLGHGEGDLTYPRPDRLVFVPIGVSLPFFVALIQTRFQVPLPLDLHGRVDHGADQFRQVIHPIRGNLFHNFCRQCKIILVGPVFSFVV